MRKSVLIEIVRSLGKKESREVSKWLASPAHNQREDVVRLFEYLMKHDLSEDNIPEKENAWKAIFPKQPYDDAYMRQVMYFLMKALEEYLVFSDAVKDEVQFQLTLTKIYRTRKLEKAYRQAHRLSSESLERQPLRNSYYLLKKFLLQQEYSQRMAEGDFMKSASSNLQETSDALDQWFLAEKLQISNSMLNHSRIYPKANYHTGMLPEILPFAEKNLDSLAPVAAMHYYSYMTAIHPTEESFFNQFEQLVLVAEEQFYSSDELREFYRAALNYCTGKVNRGNISYCKNVMKIYEKGMANMALLEKDQLSRYSFGNAVAAAIKIKEFDWAEKFIRDSQQYLDDKERNSIVQFNQSRLFFEKGDYDKAQRLLRDFEYDDMLFNIIAKTMLLKIYYETGEYDAFESLIESMRSYLQRKETLDPNRKAAYKNLISLMKKLLNLNPYSKVQREKLREQVVAAQPLMEREWLLNQLDKMK